jgi:hypothetical protein
LNCFGALAAVLNLVEARLDGLGNVLLLAAFG